MKTQITLILCFLSLLLSSKAQPQMQKYYEHQHYDNNFEQIDNENIISNHNKGFGRNLFSKSKHNNSNIKGDWFEPDTIYVYSVQDFDQRRIYSYENGKCSVILGQRLKNNEWENCWKETYAYDTQNNISSYLSQIWSLGKWTNNNKYTYTYDKQNNKISEIYQEGQWESDQWMNIYKYTYTYDTLNKMTTELHQGWQSNQWKNSQNFTYTYDAQNYLIESLMQYWLLVGQWDDFLKTTYTYDTLYNITEILYEQWGDYPSLGKIKYTYDAQNNNIEKISQRWLYEQWYNISKRAYDYDEYNNLTSDLAQNWESNQWKFMFKYLYIYDTRNNMTEKYEFLFEEYPIYKWIYNYNENNNATSGYAQMLWEGSWNDCNCGWLDIYFNNMQSLIRLNERHRFTTSFIKINNVSIKENTDIGSYIKVFPNPVSSIMYIETNNFNSIPDINIYSVHGTLLQHAKGYQINIESLSRGIYFAEINGIVRKIVKQ